MAQERAVFLFDGPNFYKNLQHSRLIKGNLNIMSLATSFAGPRQVIGVFFYTSPTDQKTDSDNYAKQQKFFAALQSSGIELKLGKLVRRSKVCPTCNEQYWFKTEKSVDVQLAMALVLGATKNEWDVAYLVSCDSDLIPAVEYARSIGKKVFLIMPEGARCYGVGTACNKTLTITQDRINQCQVL